MKVLKSKKILIVDNSAWNIYNFRQPHIKKLLKEGYEVVVLSPIDEYIGSLTKQLLHRHLPLYHLRPNSRNLLHDLHLIIELFQYYRREKPDLVIHFTIKPNVFGSLVARLLNIPAISVITGLGYPFLHPTGINRLVPILFKLAFRRIEKLILYNPDDRDELVKRKIISQAKTRIVPGSGVNTHHFRPMSYEKKERPFVFLFVGRLLKDKGLIEFVQAAKRIAALKKNVECWVIGNFTFHNPSAVESGELHDWVQARYIRYFGFATDVRDYLKKAEVLVMPSQREGIPRSILEGMAMSKPIITTQSAGCKETVIHGVNGLLVPVGNSAALVDAMLYMLEAQPTQLRLMGEQSRKRALEIFDEKIITQRFLEVINETLPISEHEECTRTGSSAIL